MLLHKRRHPATPAPAAPELRAALADKGVAVPGCLEARHIGGVLEPQVGARVQQLLGAAPAAGLTFGLISHEGGTKVLKLRGDTSRWRAQGEGGSRAARASSGKRHRQPGAPGLARHVAEPVGTIDPFTQNLSE